MKIMVVGGGGREHAIIRSLKKNPEAEVIYALPGNGGIARDAVCVPIGAKDIDGIVAFAKEKGIGILTSLRGALSLKWDSGEMRLSEGETCLLPKNALKMHLRGEGYAALAMPNG